ncbi:hypothetical protein IW15_21575 [Chryseobacterium soli]|uniref:Uncharacterized protein n=1 Tax=Chryseobacterium soli TaxID=445961 RepID=A0A086A0B5_9FLAO|nr:hypothetical protein [Chryseobacterium soli]KFF10129.1 hypothetical protein IW15_21575 [Chryseobacterium soli]
MNTLEFAIHLWTALIFAALIYLSDNKTTKDDLPKFLTCDDPINIDNLIVSFEMYSVEGLLSLRIKKIHFIPT